MNEIVTSQSVSAAETLSREVARHRRTYTSNNSVRVFAIYWQWVRSKNGGGDTYGINV
jgi:hypothetical protein